MGVMTKKYMKGRKISRQRSRSVRPSVRRSDSRRVHGPDITRLLHVTVQCGLGTEVPPMSRVSLMEDHPQIMYKQFIYCTFVYLLMLYLNIWYRGQER